MKSVRGYKYVCVCGGGHNAKTTKDDTMRGNFLGARWMDLEISSGEHSFNPY